MKKYQLIIYAFLILSIGMACDSSTEKEKRNTETEAIKVKVVEAQYKLVSRNEKFSGELRSMKSVQLSTKLMGKVTYLKAKEGEQVRKGDLLVSIDSKALDAKKVQAQAGVAQAQAVYENATKDYNRFEKLLAQKSATQKELDDIKTHWLATKAQLAVAREMAKELAETLKYKNIYAPFDGVVIKKYLSEGSLANPGMPILALIGANDLEVVAKIPEGNISKFENNKKVVVYIAAIAKSVNGTVERINYNNQTTGSAYQVTIKLDKEQSFDQFKNGMQVTVSLADDTIKELLIPESAIVHKGQLEGIYVVGTNNKARLRWLRLGEKNGTNYVVLSGLKVKEKFIENYKLSIKDGVSISY